MKKKSYRQVQNQNNVLVFFYIKGEFGGMGYKRHNSEPDLI